MIAVLGCGAWGKNLVRNFRDLGVLSAVVDTAALARGVAAEVAPGVPIYDSATRALADPRVDAIAIATPAATHADLCAHALSTGKDVFCEKPLALRVGDATRLSSAAEGQARILMVGHILEYHPAIRALRRIVADGTLGPLRYIHASRLHPAGPRHVEDALWALAPHDVSVILRLVGALPREVVAHAGARLSSGDLGIAAMHFTFRDGLTAHVHVSSLHHFKEQRLVIVGAARTAVFDDVTDRLVLHERTTPLGAVASSKRDLANVRSAGQEVAFPRSEPLRLECEAFVDALRSRVAPLTDGRSAVDVLRVVHAAESSIARGGTPVAI